MTSRLLQRRLVRWRSVLAASTRAVDYAGALLNYVLVGAAVFAGGCCHLLNMQAMLVASVGCRCSMHVPAGWAAGCDDSHGCHYAVHPPDRPSWLR